MHSNGLLVMVAMMIDDHEWRGAEVRRNFGVLSLSFQTVRRIRSVIGNIQFEAGESDKASHAERQTAQ